QSRLREVVEPAGERRTSYRRRMPARLPPDPLAAVGFGPALRGQVAERTEEQLQRGREIDGEARAAERGVERREPHLDRAPGKRSETEEIGDRLALGVVRLGEDRLAARPAEPFEPPPRRSPEARELRPGEVGEKLGPRIGRR